MNGGPITCKKKASESRTVMVSVSMYDESFHNKSRSSEGLNSTQPRKGMGKSKNRSEEKGGGNQDMGELGDWREGIQTRLEIPDCKHMCNGFIQMTCEPANIVFHLLPKHPA